MLVELIKGVKQRSRRGIRPGKMLIDREKMLVLPFSKTPHEWVRAASRFN